MLREKCIALSACIKRARISYQSCQLPPRKRRVLKPKANKRKEIAKIKAEIQ